MSETLIGKAFTNSFSFPGGFVVQADKPIDDRLVVHSVASLTAANTFVSSTDNLLKAYNGMVVSVLETNEIYILTDVANITNINSWKKINVPQASSTDEGKLLTVEKVNVGTTESPVYKYEGRWVDTPSGLPTINGTSDANKILQVNAGGTGVAWVKAPEELPTYSSTESGKVLTVSSDGTSTEWGTVDTELMKVVTNVQLFQLATSGQLKPGMKYRITDYAPAVNTEYKVTINSAHHYAAPSAAGAVKFDIIVTASSPNTLFEDVELMAKTNVPTVFDYTKYEVKYDFIGNINGPKYDYIRPDAGGVIYYMKDQFGNEASYDFENIFYIGSTPGISLYTFSGWKSGDLRQYGIIQNVRMKNSRETLPGIIFDFPLYQNNNSAQIIDVELNNCTGIYTKSTNLRHAKISNSHTVNIKMEYDDTIMSIPYPMFENLNICNNDDLHITDVARTILPFGEEYGGFYVNNLNILPSLIYKNISLVDIAAQMTSIFKQGLIDSDVLNKMGITPDSGTGNWLLAVMNQEATEDASRVLFAQQWPTILVQKYELLVYDAIKNASKNIRPFNIFNAVDDNSGHYINWNLEIPHFQSTATSVYELGI